MIGTDISYYIGIQIKIFSDVVGTHGIDNWNTKGKDFLFLLKTNWFKIVLSYFTHTNYVTYRFNIRNPSHVYNNYIRYNNFF